MQISPPAVPHVACGLIHLNLLANTTTKLVLVGIHFLLFYTNLNFYLVFRIFLGSFLTLCMKIYYTAIIVYHLNFLWKSFQWLWYYCFSHSYYTCLLGFLSSSNKKSFKRKNLVGRKSCQLKVLKVLQIHLFVTLLINKTTSIFSLIHWKIKIRRSF